MATPRSWTSGKPDTVVEGVSYFPCKTNPGDKPQSDLSPRLSPGEDPVNVHEIKRC